MMCMQVCASIHSMASGRAVAQEAISLATRGQLHCRPCNSHAEPQKPSLDLRHLQAAGLAYLHQAGTQPCTAHFQERGYCELEGNMIV